jgi:glycosyltransferase involved in cell wall biosynthesis
MKIIYLTSKKFPASTADHFFVREMAGAFTKILQKNFLLIVANNFANDLTGISYRSLGLNIKRGLSIWYFIWLPLIVQRKNLNNVNTVFFSNDANLLTVLIIWKKIFQFKYRIVSDWHMLFEDWRDRFIANNCSYLITTTNHLKDLLLENNQIRTDRILPVYGGVNMKLFDAVSESMLSIRELLGLPTDAFIVGYIGFYKTMGMSKGLDTMIEALALIPDMNVKMVFVGGKSDEIDEYRRLAEASNLVDRIIFVPVVPSERIAVFEKAMDVLVIPYPDEPHFKEYGFPMKAYEYMASGRPIIFSNLPIISEVLGDCATVFKPGDARDLADKILLIKNDSIKYDILAKKAYDKVKDFTWEKRAEKIVEFVNN